MRRILSPVLIAGAALAAAALATGCGGTAYPKALTPTPTSVANPSSKAGARPLGLRAQLLAAVDGTEAAHTARVSWHADAKAADQPASSIDATGVIDFQAPALDMFVTTTDGTDSASSEVRVVNGVAYSNEAGRWESAPAAEQTQDGSDPNDELAYLRGVADDVRVAGRDTLHGVVATRYTATVDLASAVPHVADAPTRARVEAALKVFEAQVPVTVWIAGGQVRKLAMTLDVLPGIAGQTGDAKIEISFEFYDFGIAVHVVAPVHP